MTTAFEDPFKREHLRAPRQLESRQHWMDRGEQAELLRSVLGTSGGHKAFNLWLRWRHATWINKWGQPMDIRPARMLLGVHDVLNFLEEATAHEPSHGRRVTRGTALRDPVLFHATQAFLQAFKKHRGHVEATLAALGLKGGKGRPVGVPSL
ncbi:hypothetical protein [Hyalangium versicolor]|uniref:hypothetical protein n=1 Tax=Hyalangium versicolor TaxID=2861190 RepID=UPI001CCCB780|nr:hypothetical protein [Hyalangium versicolor]